MGKEKACFKPFSVAVCFVLLVLPVSGLNVIIHTWTGASDVCRHLRQTEKQE